VDDVGPEQERDAEPALLHGYALRLAALGRAHAVEQRAHASRPDLFEDVGGPPCVHLRIDVRGERTHGIGEHAQLAHLLVEGHAGDQVFDAGIAVHVAGLGTRRRDGASSGQGYRHRIRKCARK